MLPQGHAVPKSLEINPRFLFWEVEDVLITCVGIIVGGLLNHPFIGGGFGAVAAWIWRRLSSKCSRGFALHLTYWWLDGFQLERTPPSHKRRLLG